MWWFMRLLFHLSFSHSTEFLFAPVRADFVLFFIGEHQRTNCENRLIEWSIPVPMLIIIYFDKYSIWFLFLINHIYCMWISIALHSSILVFLLEYLERLQTFAHEWWTIKYFGHATTTANSSILLHRSNGAGSLFRSFPTVSFSNQIN